MYFEIIPPAGFSADPSAIGASLSCNSKERPSVVLSPELGLSKEGLSVLSGRVELHYRASWRLLALELPDSRSILFQVRLPSDPTVGAKHRQWSPWYVADHVNYPGQSEPVRVNSDADSFKIRYRIEFWMEPKR
jgi:hypothetical protein